VGFSNPPLLLGFGNPLAALLWGSKLFGSSRLGCKLAGL
jgi:hypothetical protein